MTSVSFTFFSHYISQDSGTRRRFRDILWSTAALITMISNILAVLNAAHYAVLIYSHVLDLSL